MNKEKPSVHYISPLNRAKGLGSAHHGLAHWWLQRVTALALIPLSLWFVSTLVCAVMFPTPELVAEWLTSPINAIALSLMVVALFSHSYLGIHEIIADYIKCPLKKYMLVIGVKFLAIVFAAACLLSIMRMHFLDVSF